jgi:hypothetical protein
MCVYVNTYAQSVVSRGMHTHKELKALTPEAKLSVTTAPMSTRGAPSESGSWRISPNSSIFMGSFSPAGTPQILACSCVCIVCISLSLSVSLSLSLSICVCVCVCVCVRVIVYVHVHKHVHICV